MCFCTPSIRTPFCDKCPQAMFLRINELTKQRDELLAALEELYYARTDKAERTATGTKTITALPGGATITQHRMRG